MCSPAIYPLYPKSDQMFLDALEIFVNLWRCGQIPVCSLSKENTRSQLSSNVVVQALILAEISIFIQTEMGIST